MKVSAACSSNRWIWGFAAVCVPPFVALAAPGSWMGRLVWMPSFSSRYF